MKRKIFSVFFALMLALSMSLVTAVPVVANGDPVENTTTLDTFTNIQAAIDDEGTVAGHTILVDDTYDSSNETTWPIDVDKGVTIRSVYGPDVTTIDPGDAGRGVIEISAVGVTIDGFTIIQGTEGIDATHPAEHVIWVHAEYSTIKNCAILGEAGSTAGIFIGDRTADTPTGTSTGIWGYNVSTPLGHTIQYNSFRHAAAGEGWGINAYDLSDSVISHNSFVGDGAPTNPWDWNALGEGTPATAIKITNATVGDATGSPGGGYVLIEHNVARYIKYSWLTFCAAYPFNADPSDTYPGSMFEQSEASEVDGVIVRNNTVHNVSQRPGDTGDPSHSTAVKFMGTNESNGYGVGGADLTIGPDGVTIGPGNNFFANDIGVKVDGPTDYDAEFGCVLDAFNIVINNNNIYNNTACGVFNGTDDADQEGGAMTIAAEDNWWGSASGPEYIDYLGGSSVTPSNTYVNAAGDAQGNIVTDHIDYVPWLDGEYPEGASFAPATTDENPAGEYSSIQSAIDGVGATTITCAPGTYTETLVIPVDLDGLVLESATKWGAIIDANSVDPGDSRIIDVYAPNVTIDGFHLIGNTHEGQRGIYLRNNGFTVQNNLLNDIANDGIFLDSSQNVITSGQIVDNDLVGQGNASSHHRAGILLQGYGGNSISGVTISGNDVIDYGNKVGTPSQPMNGLSGESTGIKVVDTGDGDITDVTVIGNTVSACWRGIDLRGSLRATSPSPMVVAGNDVDECGTGVRIAPLTGIEIMLSGSTLYNNTIGVLLEIGPHGPGIDTSGVVIDGNTIYHNNPDSSKGIWFLGGEGGTISDNCIVGNDTGIKLDEPVSHVDILDNCIIENSGDGIYIAGCHNTIDGNVISSNGDDGVHLTNTALQNVINYNDITLNNIIPDYGVFNANFVSVDATNNWWGDASGPTHSSNPGGTGDAVSDNVFYDPWETSPLVDTTAPTIISSGASPQMVSIWYDAMFDSMWSSPVYDYSVGPDSTILSVIASDNLCGIARVTKDLKALLLDLIPEEKLQKFIDQYQGGWDAFWVDMASDMCVDDLEAVEMEYDYEYGCWHEYEYEFINGLLYSTFSVLNLDGVEVAEIMGQELLLGDHQIEVTAYDYSGNPATGYIYLTFVDFQMPVCEGWNLRSTWLTLENNGWQDIVATMDEGNADSLLRWNNAYQRWEGYDEVSGVGGWYYSGSRIADALMVPLEAYWMHALVNDQFGLITSRTVTAPPSHTMYAGWSLIGATIAWDESRLKVNKALMSIYEGEGLSIGYTQVLSIDQYNDWNEYFYICGTYPDGEPYVKWFKQETWVFTRGSSIFNRPWMTRGGGYWVFMSNPAVLGGFSHTPLPMDFWDYWWSH